jgi:hypothetical protein
MRCNHCGEREGTVLMLYPTASAQQQSSEMGKSGWVCDSCARDLADPRLAAMLNDFQQQEAEANDAVAMERADPHLHQLLVNVSVEVERELTDVPALCGALDELLTFLTSQKGATYGYCRAASLYIADMRTVSAQIPDNMLRILADMAGAMCESYARASEVEAMKSTPAQLLERVRRLRVSLGISS